MTSEQRLAVARDASAMRRARRLRVLLALGTAAVFTAGCAAAPAPDSTREYLDEQTAATVTVGPRPLVFALERPDLAVHARDYLTLVPIDVNQAGSHVQYFYGYVWSTIDKRRAGESDRVSPRFELIADGRRIPLAPVAGKPRDIGLGEPPLPPPAASAEILVSLTTREVQAFVANADVVVAVARRGDASERFALWDR
jgi:hypothetical protein